MEKILRKALEHKDHHLATVEDFSELRHEVLNIRNFFVEPAMGHEIDATLQHHVVRYSFLILDFLSYDEPKNHFEDTHRTFELSISIMLSSSCIRTKAFHSSSKLISKA
ncbi:hypothetical protein MJO28_012621 [Puccinia striiformis f. sp. tritici]|uniref:Uncharacterized protein n=2 Tax=Puccinia striiformis TaxID=27350 RepID=A0A2S4W732_9BASI|nr:hypothetical protein MJO28_012621 [Puccinia striiformis f. sp. tritici]POW17569.1 hypothetical protein PSTT_00284 [Puccinia striiformis]